MQPTDRLSTENDLPGMSGYFLRPPLRSFYFVGNSVLVVIDLSGFVLLLWRGWDRLSLGAVLWLGMAVGCLLALWFGALRQHWDIHLLFISRRIEKVERGSPLEILLSAAAKMAYSWLFFAFFMVGAFLLACGPALHSR